MDRGYYSAPDVRRSHYDGYCRKGEFLGYRKQWRAVRREGKTVCDACRSYEEQAANQSGVPAFFVSVAYARVSLLLMA
jgi:hypothetical protein